MRKPVIAGNWKMYKTRDEARALAQGIKEAAAGVAGKVEVVLAPPFTALSTVEEAVRGTSIALSAQNVFWEPEGAYTGEISAKMLKDAGCSHVIVGHSERRQYFGETDQTVNGRTKAALAEGLVVILCVGETLEQREAGKTFEVLGRQLDGGLEDLGLGDLIIAYEPVWAIGTGKTASNEQAQEAHAFIRQHLTQTMGAAAAGGVRILYGGSVKPDNVDGLMSQPDVDGALVGGASLKADSFSRIIGFQAPGA